MRPSLESPMPLVRADADGYTYAGDRVNGFADRAELSLPVRVRLARLCERYTPKRLSASQRELLASPLAERDATRQPSPELVGFQANTLDVERAWEDGVYDELSDEQRAWISDPRLHSALSGNARYPLTLGQMSQLTGATERQLRHWTDEELLPAHRAGAHRRYYSAAVARALLLVSMTPQQVATLIALRRGGESGRRLVVMIGSVMVSVAKDADLDDKEREDVLRGARALVQNRGALAECAAS